MQFIYSFKKEADKVCYRVIFLWLLEKCSINEKFDRDALIGNEDKRVIKCVFFSFS